MKTITPLNSSDFEYVWENYNTENGTHSNFFEKTGLTKEEVRVAMRIVMQSEVYFGYFDTMCRELTRDILYYMKGIKMEYDVCFKGKYEYQIIIDKLFNLD